VSTIGGIQVDLTQQPAALDLRASRKMIGGVAAAAIAALAAVVLVWAATQALFGRTGTTTSSVPFNAPAFRLSEHTDLAPSVPFNAPAFRLSEHTDLAPSVPFNAPAFRASEHDAR
jgi:hypothetical protein